MDSPTVLRPVRSYSEVVRASSPENDPRVAQESKMLLNPVGGDSNKNFAESEDECVSHKRNLYLPAVTRVMTIALDKGLLQRKKSGQDPRYTLNIRESPATKDTDRGEGTSKGKGADPRNWGAALLDDEDIDLEEQRITLESFKTAKELASETESSSEEDEPAYLRDRETQATKAPDIFKQAILQQKAIDAAVTRAEQRLHKEYEGKMKKLTAQVKTLPEQTKGRTTDPVGAMVDKVVKPTSDKRTQRATPQAMEPMRQVAPKSYIGQAMGWLRKGKDDDGDGEDSFELQLRTRKHLALRALVVMTLGGNERNLLRKRPSSMKTKRCFQNDKPVRDYIYKLNKLWNMIGDVDERDRRELWKKELNPEISTFKEVQAAAEIIEIAHSVPVGRERKTGKRDKESHTEIGSSAISPQHPNPRKDRNGARYQPQTESGAKRPRQDPKGPQEHRRQEAQRPLRTGNTLSADEKARLSAEGRMNLAVRFRDPLARRAEDRLQGLKFPWDGADGQLHLTAWDDPDRFWVHKLKDKDTYAVKDHHHCRYGPEMMEIPRRQLEDPHFCIDRAYWLHLGWYFATVWNKHELRKQEKRCCGDKIWLGSRTFDPKGSLTRLRLKEREWRRYSKSRLPMGTPIEDRVMWWLEEYIAPTETHWSSKTDQRFSCIRISKEAYQVMDHALALNTLLPWKTVRQWHWSLAHWYQRQLNKVSLQLTKHHDTMSRRRARRSAQPRRES
ncbi:hypothetical protein DFJ58DRAFT_847754 [Suillus subalutaceus]|uniref:uncharacterized protein n=1 Tax=Suillus subalutaceus TaxID=48586 RepID=UPI001B8805F7|nr:uncharacterized protein DFJ58DRAFT_847754 [Suillus subalutaceus]KAG1833666.1 hypothetical protein DFJ58DRAFT_847754 [Suillus subalutaceus]